MDHYVTLRQQQVAAFIRRLGMYHACELSLSHLIRWLKENQTDFNLDGVREKQVLHIAPIAHGDVNTICFCVAAREHLVP
jgi:hypothetical protein